MCQYLKLSVVVFYFANTSLDQLDQKLKQQQLSLVGPGDINMSVYRALQVIFALPPRTYFFSVH